jgi:uncharacterized protein YecT (DUF1311 family)
MRVLTVTLIVALCAPLTSHATTAEETIITKEFSRCMEHARGNAQKILNCIAAERKLQDVRMNMAYKSLKQKLPDTQRTQLILTQRSWILFRDLNCKSYAKPGGGELALIKARDCGRYHTALRARELERFDN